MVAGVHHLESARNNAARDDRADAARAGLHGRKSEQQAARGNRLLQQPHSDLGDDAEQPFRARHQPQEIIELAVQMLAAEAQHLAAHQHDLEAEYVVGGQPIFEAMHAAGVLADIAADRAGDLRGGIGRIIEARIFDGFRDGEILHAGLHARAAILEIHLQYAVELGHAEQNAVLERQRAAGERGAGAARHQLHIHLLRQRHDRAHLRHRLRQSDDERQRAIHDERVAFIGAARGLVGDDIGGGQNGAQPREQLVAARDYRRLGKRHDQGHAVSLRKGSTEKRSRNFGSALRPACASRPFHVS